jgi:hypothetical protein
MKKITEFNGYLIERGEYYGFRSNTPTVEWRVYRPGGLDQPSELVGVFYKLRWAKEYISEGHAAASMPLAVHGTAA